MPRIVHVLILLACVLIAAHLMGCAGPAADTNATGTAAAAGELRECVVCKCNGDLACIDVKVNAGTPSARYKEGVFYFCSEGCREEFEKTPQAFLRR